MIIRFKIILLCFFILCSFSIKANQQELDSLLNLTVNESKDSVLLGLYNKIGSASYRIDQKLAKSYWLKSLKLAKEFIKNDTASYFKEQLAIAYNGMGIISRREGDYTKALDYYQNCLKIEDKLYGGTKLGNTFMNIGIIYREMKEYETALEYVNKSLDFAIKNKDRVSYSSNYNALGMVYRRMKEYDKAIECYEKSLEASIAVDEQSNIAQSYNNIGAVLFRQKKYDKALEYLNKGYEIHLANNNEAGIVRHHANLVAFYNKIGDTKNALKEAKMAYDIYKDLGRKVEQSNVAASLSMLYDKLGDYKKALTFYKEYVTLRDSVFNEQNTREITQKEMQFTFDKKVMADSLARVEQEKIQQIEYQQELNQQRTYTISGIIILVIVLVFTFVIFKRLKISNQQKATIQEQKLVVEEKNKEILDSINYAKRIQKAILPSIENIKESFPNFFVLYKPKDIVAGDFYWYTKKQDKIYLAVADCTGHGVPGAMVSVVCHNALHRSVNGYKLEDPAEILDKTAELVINAFKKNDEEVKDGMDIALCCFDIKNNTLNYAGAINSLFYINKNGLNEIKGDKQPIGQYENLKPFTSHKVELEKGDTVYMFSDGYPDQFGGEKGKKYMYRRFRELITNLSKVDFAKQEKKLEQEFENWRGGLEQLDDVCIVGVKF